VGVRAHRDPAPDLIVAFRAALEGGRIDLMAGGPEALRHRLPYPATLIRAMDENIGRDISRSASLDEVQRQETARGSEPNESRRASMHG